MTYREDFIAAMTHREVQPVPFTVKFTVEAHENWRAHLGRDFDPVADTGSYVVASHTNSGWEQVRPGFFRDYYGVVWNKTHDRTLGIVEDPPLKTPSFDGFRFPDPDAIPVYDFIRRHQQRYPDRFHMVSIGFTLFERAWTLVGMDKLFIYLMLEPDFIHELLERITEYNIRVIENAADVGVDCVHYGDDWGAQNGLLISREMWREFIGPRFARTCQAAHRRGLYNSLHCCGAVADLIPDMIDCGVDVFDPFQPEAMDIWALRERYRGRMAFWGGLSVQETLPRGSAGDVRRATHRLLEQMAPGGGYILAPAHSLTGDIPPENIAAFLEVARGQGARG